MLENANILVTGGAGFIGSALTEYFLTNHNSVTVLDNFSTGKRENIESFLDDPHFQLIEGDIRDIDTCLRAAEKKDYIFHEAALGSVPRSIRDPLATISVNDMGFANMLHAAVKAKVRRFVYASSSSVYGDSPVLPKTELHTGQPLSPYAATKAVDEIYASVFRRVYGLDCTGLRYFNVFGRRQNPDGPYAAVIPLFFSKLLHHESPVINGDGTNSRDFTYIDNVVYANELAAEAGSDASGKVFNVACGGRITLTVLFEMIRSNASAFDEAIAKIEPVYGPSRQGDIPHSCADISLARRILGYEVLVSVKEGLRLASEWYHENL